MTIRGHRMMGGLKIYNAAGCRRVCLYETVVGLYKHCLKVGAPRCGDDSLMVLLQTYYPAWFKLFPSRVHALATLHAGKSLDPTTIQVFHFVGKTKYWHQRSMLDSLGIAGTSTRRS